MATKIDIVAGDKGYSLTFTLENSDGTAYDITGMECNLKVQVQGGSALAFTGAMTVTGGAAGQCQYTVLDGDFDDVGPYYAEIEVSGGGTVVTFQDIVITAKPQLPRL